MIQMTQMLLQQLPQRTRLGMTLVHCRSSTPLNFKRVIFQKHNRWWNVETSLSSSVMMVYISKILIDMMIIRKHITQTHVTIVGEILSYS
mmetsp:Transcript_41451/g.61121  ORF Transcript_41451/g.61121 Transcript_41451/m.61121 type:complete len:90 (+) Transcript_41451:148-417(+)